MRSPPHVGATLVVARNAVSPLMNKFNIKDGDKLQEMEQIIYRPPEVYIVSFSWFCTINSSQSSAWADVLAYA